MKEIQAPKIIPHDKSRYLFLAGSIEMGAAEKWQERVVRELKDSVWTMLNPRRDDWDSSWKQSLDDERFVEQVSWELEAMERAEKILMYFDPNTKSPITLLELGLNAYRNDVMVVVCPKEFWRKGNVDVTCARYKIRQFNSLTDAINYLRRVRDVRSKNNLREMKDVILQGDVLEKIKEIPDESVDCVITSPPYWNMRDYKMPGQIGLEDNFTSYVSKLIEVFDEVRRVLKSSGTCFVNLGDTYRTGSGVDENRVHTKQGTLKSWINGRPNVSGYEKSLLMLPERFAIAMSERDWKIRNKIIWHKKNAMPSSVLDRLSNKYELVYFFVKDNKYFFNLDSIRIPYETDEKRPDGVVRAREFGYNTKAGTKQREEEEEARKFGKRRPPKASGEYIRNQKGKNPGDVWTLTLQPHKERHIAMFPEKLITPMILAGCPEGGVVFDPFLGSGTTAVVAKKLGRSFIGIDLNPEYIKIAQTRINGVTPSLFSCSTPVDK